MESGGRGWRHTLARLFLALVVLALGGGLAFLLHTRGLEAAAGWSQLVSVGLAIAPLVGWWRRSPTEPSMSSPDQVEQAQRALAALVAQQWRQEILARQLDNPAPLSLRWRLTARDVMEQPDQVFPAKGLLQTLLSVGRPRFDGNMDQIDRLVEQFRALSQGRLVILGEPGMGKTTLAVLIVRELLSQRRAEEPVPVLLSLSNWDPIAMPFHEWLTGRLRFDYPALRSPEFGPDAPARLVTEAKVLPVLDGLDELPAELRPKAVQALNAALAKGDPVILTCRTREYEAAVEASDGGVLRAAAVIEPHQVTFREAADYLAACLPSRPGGSWPDICATVARGSGPLAHALTSPLDLWLLRRIYIDSHNDPAELLDTTRFPDPTSITDHLLDHLVVTTIRARPDGTAKSWKPADANRWLGFLAHHLSRLGTRDLAWWQLAYAVEHRFPYRLIGGIVVGMLFAALTGPAGWFGGWLVGRPQEGLIGALVGGFVLGLVFGFGASPSVQPAYAELRLGRVQASYAIRSLVMRVAVGVLASVAIGLAIRLTVDHSVDLLGFALVGVSFGLLLGVMALIARPQRNDLAQSPPSTLRRDLQLAYVRTIGSSLMGGFVLGISFGVLRSWAIVIVVAAVAVIIADRLIGGPPQVASSIYLADLTSLALRRRLPIRLMAFLEYAYQLGLLRQTGSVYQFRHAKLQDRLAESTPASRS